MKTYYRPAHLARLTRVSTDTLRHYERLGLIAKATRSANGYREYSVECLERVRVIQSALSIGFTLAELARIFKIRDRGGVPCREVRDLAAAKADELAQQIVQMKRLRARLQQLLTTWDGKLKATTPNSRAGLLEGLSGIDLPPKNIKLRRKRK